MIIFTDLDGSLLNHEDYSWENAASSLARIREEGIPLILATSKTRAETERIRTALGISDPFIVENGGAVFFPEGYFGNDAREGDRLPPYRRIRLGKTYAEVRVFVEERRERFRIRGFGDLDIPEIAGLTGLPVEQATLAKAREFTEPFLIDESDQLPLLDAEARRVGLKITSGGRFHHLIGMEQDKGAAVKKLTGLYRRFRGAMGPTVVLGDGLNDVPMLEQADIPVLIPRPDGTRQNVRLPNLVVAPFAGSLGWNAAMGRILSEQKELYRSLRG